MPVSPEHRLPAVGAVAMIAWLLLEFAARRGLVPHLADVVGTGRGADALVLLFGFPLIAAVVAWWSIRAGVGRDDWDYELSLRSVGAGLGGAVAYFAVFVALAFVLSSVLGIEQSVGANALGASGAPPFRVASRSSARSSSAACGPGTGRPPAPSPTWS